MRVECAGRELAALAGMSPPRWADEPGRPRPTRPCPRCRRVIPVNRGQQEVVLVPEGDDGWYSEIPVLGVAR